MEDIELLLLFADRNAKWFSYFGKQLGNFLQNWIYEGIYPGSPVFRIQHFYCQGPRFNESTRELIACKLCGETKKNETNKIQKKKNKNGDFPDGSSN